VPEQQSTPSPSPDASGQSPAGGTEQEQDEQALERALGGGGPALPDATKAPPAPAAAPAAPGTTPGNAPGASEQDDAAKALERAMNPPPDGAKGAAPK